MPVSDEDFLENELALCSHIFTYDCEKILDIKVKSRKPELEGIYRQVAGNLVNILELLDKENDILGYPKQYIKIVDKIKKVM